jgi:hypothetical protein
MAPMVKRSDPGKPREIGGSSLAESVAHELNNIAASLFGFVELAAEEVDPGSPVLRCLGEIRIGVSRVRNLATALEALAEVDGNSTRIAIGECVGGNAPLDSGGGLRFDWKCDPATLVDADPERVHHALRTLSHLGRTDSIIGSDREFTVSRTASESQCSYCSAVLPAGSIEITLIADGVPTAGARRGAGRTFPQLVITGSVHATHVAGGHVALDAARSSISLVLPAAPPAKLRTTS